jgi:hypothetical protein
MLKRLQNAAVIALAVLFVTGFGVEVWRASDIPHASINQNAPAQKKNKARSETIEERHQATEEAIAYYNKWLMFFTAVLAIATLGLGVATVGLYRISERQLRHAENESRRARAWRRLDDMRIVDQFEIARQNADAAKESANASIRQAKIAETALVQLERPYVFIFGVRGIKQDAASQDFFVEYTIANYGKMPAIIEAPHIGFVISERGEPPTPTLMFDGHSLMNSPILQAGEQRKKIREYFPAGMVGEDIIARVDRVVRAADIEPSRVLLGASDGLDEISSDIVPTFNIPDGFDLFFRAVIRYRGPSTAGHETGAVWLYYPDTFEFAVRGGEEHNYVR